MSKFKSKLLTVNNKYVKIIFRNINDVIEYNGFCKEIMFNNNGKWYIELIENNNNKTLLSSTSYPDKNVYFYIREGDSLNFVVSEKKIKEYAI